MNVYDKAHELARELSRSTEHLALMGAKKAVMEDSAAEAMISDFSKRQREVMMLYQSGSTPSSEQVTALQSLMEIMRQNSILNAYLEADAREGQLLEDIQKIIIDAVSDARWDR